MLTKHNALIYIILTCSHKKAENITKTCKSEETTIYGRITQPDVPDYLLDSPLSKIQFNTFKYRHKTRHKVDLSMSEDCINRLQIVICT